MFKMRGEIQMNLFEKFLTWLEGIEHVFCAGCGKLHPRNTSTTERMTMGKSVQLCASCSKSLHGF
jgi:hypothetical protein